MKIAIMQPYFIPYAGYFRLLSASDLFVVYDCVQFPRRSFVHRNQLYNHQGELDWLTLPLSKQKVDTSIKELVFRDNVQEEWRNQFARFPSLQKLNQHYPDLFMQLTHLNTTPLAYIIGCLKLICQIIDIPFNITYSSSLNMPPNLKGQDRIIQIAKHFGASDYINAPGGRKLYNENDFLHHDIKLQFLPDYIGEYHSIAEALLRETPKALKEQLVSQS